MGGCECGIFRYLLVGSGDIGRPCAVLLGECCAYYLGWERSVQATCNACILPMLATCPQLPRAIFPFLGDMVPSPVWGDNKTVAAVYRLCLSDMVMKEAMFHMDCGMSLS